MNTPMSDPKTALSEEPPVSREDRIWGAAFFDGEGCVGVRYRKPRSSTGRRHYMVQTAVSNTNHAILLWYQERWGGYVGEPRITINPSIFLAKAHNFFSTNCTWQVNYRTAKRFLTDVQPFIKVKRAQVDNALKFLALDTWQYRGDPKGLPPAVFAEQERLYLRHKEISADIRAGKGRVPFKVHKKPFVLPAKPLSQLILANHAGSGDRGQDV